MRYPLLVFDWDGTIVDSIGTIVSCVKRALGDLGLKGVSDESIRATIGLGLRETVESFLPEADQGTFERLLDRYRHHWIETYGERSQLYVGVTQTLERLSERGHILSVATGKSRRGLERDLERTALRRWFAATRTVDEAHSKPHPQMLLDLLDELGTPAAEALMIGDTTHDLDMAANADVAAVAVTCGSHSAATLNSRHPLVTLGSVAELTDWLENP